MKVVLDTAIMIDLLRGLPAARGFVTTLGERPTCSEVTRVEVLRGMRSEERRATERLFGVTTWVGVTETVARRAGQLGRQWRRSHQGIATADLIIAATAEELGLDLVTLNVKHFPMFG